MMSFLWLFRARVARIAISEVKSGLSEKRPIANRRECLVLQWRVRFQKVYKKEVEITNGDDDIIVGEEAGE